MTTGWEKGSTRAWRRARRRVLTRDGYCCRLKLDGCTTRATTAHHTKGNAMGDDPAHLVAACAPCNGKVGDRHAPTPT